MIPTVLEDAAREARWAHQDARAKELELFNAYIDAGEEADRLGRIAIEAEKRAEKAWADGLRSSA